jgi:hypothetical protein
MTPQFWLPNQRRNKAQNDSPFSERSDPIPRVGFAGRGGGGFPWAFAASNEG